MASARSASLREQRAAGNTSLTGRGGSIRLLTPTNSNINSIAKTNFRNELNAKIQQYNDGEISNDEMKTFLSSNVNNPGISETDRLSIENQIRDFDVRIIGDKLKARYDASAPNSAERIQSAQALSSFYASRASQLESGTPAQSQALQNKASWDQKAQGEIDSMNKYARQLSRARAEEQINTIPSGTSENSQAKAEMYRELAQLASDDGEVLQAQQYMATATQLDTQSQVQAENESKKAEADLLKAGKKDLVDLMNSLANDYHDGVINEDQYMFALSKIEPRITEIGDTSLALTFNRTVDTVQKNIEKGGINTAINKWGLPVKTGTGSGTAPKESVEDYQYNDSLKTAQEMLARGEISPETFTQGIGELIQERQQQLTDRAASVEAIASNNPNTYIQYNGRRYRASDVLEQVNKEIDGLQNDFNAVSSGNAKLLMVPPDQFNSSGTITKSGKDYATYRLIDPNNIPENVRDQYVADEYGNLHPVTRSQVAIDPADNSMGFLVNGEKYGLPDGTPIKVDPSGNMYAFGNQQADVYQPGTNQKLTIPVVQGQPVPSFEQASGSRGLTAPTDPVTRQSNLPSYNPQAPELQPTVLPKPAEFEQRIQAPQPVNFNLNQPTPGLDIMPKLPEIKPTQTQPVYGPPAPMESYMKPTTQPVNLNINKLPQGLTPAKAPEPTLVSKVTDVLKQSPLGFLKKKLFGG